MLPRSASRSVCVHIYVYICIYTRALTHWIHRSKDNIENQTLRESSPNGLAVLYAKNWWFKPNPNFLDHCKINKRSYKLQWNYTWIHRIVMKLNIKFGSSSSTWYHLRGCVITNFILWSMGCVIYNGWPGYYKSINCTLIPTFFSISSFAIIRWGITFGYHALVHMLYEMLLNPLLKIN